MDNVTPKELLLAAERYLASAATLVSLLAKQTERHATCIHRARQAVELVRSAIGFVAEAYGPNFERPEARRTGRDGGVFPATKEIGR